MVESGDGETLHRIADAQVQFYARAAYEGDRQAQYRVGVSQAKLGNKEVSLEWLTGLARQGDVRAMKAIARGYAPGGIYGFQREEYRHWTQKAAEAGDAQAQAELGDFYAGKQEARSRYWYKQSALQDCPAGYIGIGKACYHEALRSFGKEEAARRRTMLERARKSFLCAIDFATKDAELAAAYHGLGILYETMGEELEAPEGDRGHAASENDRGQAAHFYYEAWKRGQQEEDLIAYNRVRFGREGEE